MQKENVVIQRIRNIYAYKDMIYSLVRRELRGRYKGSVLGFLWTYINPLCQVIVYSMVFSVIFRVNIDKFYLYLIIGMMPWTFLIHRFKVVQPVLERSRIWLKRFISQEK